MEDQDIVQLYWERNPDAILETSRKYGSYCRTIAANILGSREDAEECVNDTYLRAWNAMPPSRPCFLSVFLGRITRNLSLDRWSYQRAEKRGGGELPLVLEELSQCIPGRGGTEEVVEGRLLAAAIEDFLAALPPEKQAIFLRRYFFTEPVSAIARRCGMREGAVSMALHRLREALRRHLEKRGFYP